jgi:hypothetical protein
LDLGEALSAEAKLRPTEGGGEHPPEAKSFGKSSAEDLKRREMPPPPVTSYAQLLESLAPILAGVRARPGSVAPAHGREAPLSAAVFKPPIHEGLMGGKQALVL